MTEIPGIEALDRDLRLLGERVARGGYDPRRTLRRLRWAERWPVVRVVATALVIAIALSVGLWQLALALALLVLPDRIYDWRTRGAERAALLADGDFFEKQRENLENRLQWGRSFAVLGLGLAAVIAYLASSRSEGAAGLWSLSALVAARALVQLVVLGPALLRELEDLGGQASGGWMMAFTLVFLTLAAPFLVLGGVIYRTVRRLIGRPVQDDE